MYHILYVTHHEITTRSRVDLENRHFELKQNESMNRRNYLDMKCRAKQETPGRR